MNSDRGSTMHSRIMNQFGDVEWGCVLRGGALVACLAATACAPAQGSPPPRPRGALESAPAGPARPVTAGALAIYRSDAHGFEIGYPRDLKLEDEFSSHYHLPSAWRYGALPESKGQAIVSIV